MKHHILLFDLLLRADWETISLEATFFRSMRGSFLLKGQVSEGRMVTFIKIPFYSLFIISSFRIKELRKLFKIFLWRGIMEGSEHQVALWAKVQSWGRGSFPYQRTFVTQTQTHTDRERERDTHTHTGGASIHTHTQKEEEMHTHTEEEEPQYTHTHTQEEEEETHTRTHRKRRSLKRRRRRKETGSLNSALSFHLILRLFGNPTEGFPLNKIAQLVELSC